MCLTFFSKTQFFEAGFKGTSFDKEVSPNFGYHNFWWLLVWPLEVVCSDSLFLFLLWFRSVLQEVRRIRAGGLLMIGLPCGSYCNPCMDSVLTVV